MSTVLQPRLPTAQLSRLNDYLAEYRDLFARADQARSFGLYVRGLLDGDHRKNVESIADRLRDADSPSDLAQSLQHFVTQSPWDTSRVLARYRTLIRPSTTTHTWVVHDGIVPKKGRSSVGVQRQFARSLGRKVNCQVAVILSEVNGSAAPLIGRLYLPAFWLRENQEQAERTIPEGNRRPLSKTEVALELLDELLPEGRPTQLFAEESYLSAADFHDGVAQRGISLQASGAEVGTGIRMARECFDYVKEVIGLSHFEGRTWVGWHHHLALVLAAFGYVIRTGNSEADLDESIQSLPAK
ncbi:MAG TPA: transposase [Gemmataceae bacterium]|jgi:SRSO17 transposase|nr:transposase [Gemmataceae bacterium]